MRIQLGRRYLTRGGKSVTIERYNTDTQFNKREKKFMQSEPHKIYMYQGSNLHSYTKEGKLFNHKDHELDLIKEL